MRGQRGGSLAHLDSAEHHPLTPTLSPDGERERTTQVATARSKTNVRYHSHSLPQLDAPLDVGPHGAEVVQIFHDLIGERRRIARRQQRLCGAERDIAVTAAGEGMGP